MFNGEYRYIWQHSDWPAIHFDSASLATPLAALALRAGQLQGRLTDIGFELRAPASLAALTDDVIRTSAIEGEVLEAASVRSSVARRLGVDIGALAPVDRHVEGVVDMVLDATQNHAAPLTEERLFAWHRGLFPEGRSGLSDIRTGNWRDDAKGPMQVVSGQGRRARVHFQTPPADRLPSEMRRFLHWANSPTPEPPWLKAGIAHLWFVTLHPFDDGNGRMARAVGDLMLARAEKSGERFYSLSAQIQRERSAYYDMLEATQRQETLDATSWLHWFLKTLAAALDHAHAELDNSLAKRRFWQLWAGTALNERQARVLNRLLDGFEGRLTSSKWAAIAKCSADTALRDIQGLLALGLLRRAEGGGRSTAYELVG
ncbi:MAG: Fic family protein [Rubrivivax sp.]|jgi:Fic family protein|nr:Fic family protein [Rubrivivax sp.]